MIISYSGEVDEKTFSQRTTFTGPTPVTLLLPMDSLIVGRNDITIAVYRPNTTAAVSYRLSITGTYLDSSKVLNKNSNFMHRISSSIVFTFSI